MTVTVPTMTRFMMTIEDAVDLVEYALKNGKQGDLFVKKAPAATVGTLASAIMKVYGMDGEYSVIGNRHGEKMFEVLVTQEEMTTATDEGDFFCIAADRRSLNYEIESKLSSLPVSDVRSYTSDNAERLDTDRMIALLKKAGVQAE